MSIKKQSITFLQWMYSDKAAECSIRESKAKCQGQTAESKQTLITNESLRIGKGTIKSIWGHFFILIIIIKGKLISSK